MKKIILLTALLSLVLGLNAQNISKKCYRGYVDAGYSIGVGDYSFGRFEVNTSHGYQFSPHFFLGAGLGVHFMSSYETDKSPIPLDVRNNQVEIPVFANIRCNFMKAKASPFIDLKCGAFLTEKGNGYIDASIGCRFSLNQKQAINLSLGYVFEMLYFDTFNHFTNASRLDYVRSSRINNTEAVSIKLGFEF